MARKDGFQDQLSAAAYELLLSVGKAVGSYDPYAVAKALEYIEQNRHQEIALSRMSDYTGVSIPHLSTDSGFSEIHGRRLFGPPRIGMNYRYPFAQEWTNPPIQPAITCHESLDGTPDCEVWLPPSIASGMGPLNGQRRGIG